MCPKLNDIRNRNNPPQITQKMESLNFHVPEFPIGIEPLNPRESMASCIRFDLSYVWIKREATIVTHILIGKDFLP